jgi:hypothetical protein
MLQVGRKRLAGDYTASSGGCSAELGRRIVFRLLASVPGLGSADMAPNGKAVPRVYPAESIGFAGGSMLASFYVRGPCHLLNQSEASLAFSQLAYPQRPHCCPYP